MMLPIDSRLEHGRSTFSIIPIDRHRWIYRLAVQGNFSGIALHVGLAEKYQKRYAGRVPLLLKVNGKTNIPSDDEAFSPLTSSVEDAVRLGADAVGYTLYVGSPAQEVDIAQCNEVRRDCDRYGMPLVVWAYPRGSAIKSQGRDRFALRGRLRGARRLRDGRRRHQAQRTGLESADDAAKLPKPYDTLSFD